MILCVVLREFSSLTCVFLQHYLSPEEVSTTIEMVSGVALLNQALESEDLVLTKDHLRNPSVDFNNLHEDHLGR